MNCVVLWDMRQNEKNAYFHTFKNCITFKLHII